MRNMVGFRDETVAAEYETDASLAEWNSVDRTLFWATLPPDDHYFWSAWRAEQELRMEDLKWITSKGS